MSRLTRFALAGLVALAVMPLAAGVAFSGYFDGDALAGVMGLQDVQDVALIRHAYTRTSQQRRGIARRCN